MYITECFDFVYYSDEVRELGFTVVIDMRGSTWNTVKPVLKELQESFSQHVYIVYIVKPDNFWQKQRISIGSHKYKFEVIYLMDKSLCWNRYYLLYDIIYGKCDYNFTYSRIIFFSYTF